VNHPPGSPSPHLANAGLDIPRRALVETCFQPSQVKAVGAHWPGRGRKFNEFNFWEYRVVNEPSRFGVVLQRILAARDMTQTTLAKAMRISHASLSQRIRVSFNGSGSLVVTPPCFVAKVCNVLNLTPEQTLELHTAAAQDRGYKIADYEPPRDMLEAAD
jgi:DNA-binding Xre family transcriptional regulator